MRRKLLEPGTRVFTYRCFKVTIFDVNLYGFERNNEKTEIPDALI